MRASEHSPDGKLRFAYIRTYYAWAVFLARVSCERPQTSSQLSATRCNFLAPATDLAQGWGGDGKGVALGIFDRPQTAPLCRQGSPFASDLQSAGRRGACLRSYPPWLMSLRSCSQAATCPESFGSATPSGGRQGPGHLWSTTFSVIFGRVGFYLPQNRSVLTNTAADLVVHPRRNN